MSSVFTIQDGAKLVSRFLKATTGMSLRAAGKLGGVSHTKVAEWKVWEGAGGDPAELAPLQGETVESLRHYLAMADEIEARRAALRLAADRLVDLAKQLREEAIRLPVSHGGSSALAKVRAGRGAGPGPRRAPGGEG